MIQICCQTTHRQIRSGSCPWCNSPLPENQVDRNPTSNILGATWWDVSRMLADLGNKACEKVRLTTAANLADHFEGLEEAIPALKKAINDPLEEVRELAQQAFYRLASSVGIEQLPYYESELRRDPNDLAMLRIVLVLYLIFTCNPTMSI